MTNLWSINGRFLTQALTGVQRHADEVVRALDAMVSSGHPAVAGLTFELLVPQGDVRDLNLKSIALRRVAGPGGHAWEQGVLPRHVKGGLLSLGNTGPVTVRRHIVCIHDVNVRLHPESYSASFRLLYRNLLPALGRTARQITTVSNFSASQLANFKVAPSSKITVVPNGYEHAMRWKPAHSEKTKAVAGRSTIVLLGSLAPHKNTGLILRLAPQLAAKGLKLAVVGGSDPSIFTSIGANPDAPNIHWLGRVSDEALAALLQDCLCLAFPSLTEGFGLPPLEAMALGCPVVVSNAGSLPEVCGDAALYAGPQSPNEWLKILTALEASPGQQQDLSTRGSVRSRAFSWQTAAEIYAGLMRKTDSHQ